MLIRIDPEFKALIPPLKPEEFEQLEKNIIAEGCRDALVLWNGTLIDGHNRHDICARNNIEYKTKEMEFASREDVEVWIIFNQLGRRNLTDGWKYELTSKAKSILLEKGKEKKVEDGKRYHKGNPKVLSENDKTLDTEKPTKRHNTQKEIAKKLDWSTGKTAQADYIWKHAPEQIKEKVKAGEESISSAYTKVKKEVRKQEIKQERQQIAESAKAVKPSDRWKVEQGDIKTWQTDEKFDFIITDPPYPKEYVELYEVLAQRANEWLKPGGAVVAMCGQSYLDEIYRLMSKHLQYYWTACYLTPGQSAQLRQVNVNTNWKPLLIFKRHDEKYAGRIFGDVFRSGENDKDFHKWGQSVSGMSDIINKICVSGNSILDPFNGAGTTGVAALRHGCLYTGIDLLEENVLITRRRLSDEEKK